MAYVPNIGVKGIFTLLTPFTDKVIANVPYECIAVRKLVDVAAAGEDPKALYYTPNELDDTAYSDDVANGVCIVTLQAGALSTVYVPSSYISGFPRTGGIPYTQLLLAADLGAIPDSVDLTYLKSKIADTILETIGVTAEVKVVVASPTTFLSEEDSEALETARTAAIEVVTTDHALFLAEQAKNTILQGKLDDLVAYITSLNLPPTP